MPQKWEYKVILRQREISNSSYNVGDWACWEDGKSIGKNVDIIATIRKLGEAGWELVSISPRASYATEHAAVAGTTTDELWVFKRSK